MEGEVGGDTGGDGGRHTLCLVLDNGDLLRSILGFAHKKEYLFVGLVNKSWYVSYNSVGTKKTNLALCFKSVSRLREAVGHPSFSTLDYVHHVMKCGSVDVMRHALHGGLVSNLNGALEHAIRSNDARLISVLEKEFGETRFGPACMVAAVESGSLALVQKYCADGVLDHRAPNFGLEGNYLYPFDTKAKKLICLQWKLYVGDYLIEAAKQCGYFKILKWLHHQQIPRVNDLEESYDVIGAAAAHGNKDMVEWMLAVGYHPSACEISYSCHCNDVDYLEWLISKGCIVDPDSLDYCKNNDPIVIAWLKSKGFSLKN